MGSSISILFDEMCIDIHQGIVETKIVDTLGAGDAFAARFLVEYFDGRSIDIALSLAAQSAAETCSYFGAFGHGRMIQTE